MPQQTHLYSLDRAGFNEYARAYYQDPRYRMAEPLAASVLEAGEHPLEITWPLSLHSLPGLPHFMHSEVRRAYRAAWHEPLRRGPDRQTLRLALEGGTLAAHVPEQPSTDARFHVPRRVRVLAAGLSPDTPRPAPVREALEASRDRLNEEARLLKDAAERFDAFTGEVGATFEAVKKLDLLGFVSHAASALSRMERERQSPSRRPPRRLKDYEQAVGFLDGALAALGAWEASGAAERTDSLREFYRDAALDNRYVVVEQSPVPGEAR